MPVRIPPSPSPLAEGVRPAPDSEDPVSAMVPTVRPSERADLFFGSGRGQMDWVAGDAVHRVRREVKPYRPLFLAEAGKELRFHLTPEEQQSLQTPGTQKVSLQIHSSASPESTPVVLPLTDGSRDLRTGKLLFFPASYAVPEDARGELQLTLLTEGADGEPLSTHWNPGQSATILPQDGATLAFQDDFSVQQSGTLRAGDRLSLAYDVDRLTGEGERPNKIYAHVSFDGEPPRDCLLYERAQGEVRLASLLVPERAQEVSIWFSSEKDGQRAYDSNFAKNFRFPIGLPQPDSNPRWKKLLLETTQLTRLTNDNFVALGPPDGRYNCIAWSLDVRDQWVWPGERLEDFVPLYEEKGYALQPDQDTSLEEGKQKVALFLHRDKWVSHAAIQTPDGRWLSKIGSESLILHDTLEDIAGGPYGEVSQVFARPRPEKEWLDAT